MAPKHTIVLVDSTETLNECISDISPTIQTPSTKLAIDLEGVDLGRNGRIAILQIVAAHSDTIWLVDVTTLGSVAFEHADDEGRSLKAVLEGRETKKVSNKIPRPQCSESG